MLIKFKKLKKKKRLEFHKAFTLRYSYSMNSVSQFDESKIWWTNSTIISYFIVHKIY